jgi:hypothetical protein
MVARGSGDTDADVQANETAHQASTNSDLASIRLPC